MRTLSCALAFVAAIGATSCSNMTATQQRTLSGGAIGAAGGAAIGAMAGNAGLGAGIGAGAGLLGGYLYDSYEKSKGN
jgi:osmotically inducible lipoprotein OsmB